MYTWLPAALAISLILPASVYHADVYIANLHAILFVEAMMICFVHLITGYHVDFDVYSGPL